MNQATIAADASLPKHAALSQAIGYATEPKDFDWLAKNIPCQTACPAGTDIPEYLAAIARGDYDGAYKINLEDNVFPAILGRVCSRPCEDECRHGWEGNGESVAICFSKRSSSDLGIDERVVLPQIFPESGKTVAVVGSGVAGLAAARNLALYGHKVTVYEKHSSPGGMLNQGIPEFRLPRDLIDKEIQQVAAANVEIICNTDIGVDLALAKLQADNDAVIMAAGTLRPNILDLPGAELKGIRHGLDFLLEANEFDHEKMPGNVVVIGGGFTAMDCSRTALRLGADKVGVYYRRSTNEMLVTPGELEELEHESIAMETMVSPVAYVGNDDGQVTAIRFIRTELGEPDESGRRRPINIEGSEFDVHADWVLLATGQFPDTAWIDDDFRPRLVDDDHWLLSGENHDTGVDNIFVAGDFAAGASTLIDAIGHAKACARTVDTYLAGEARLTDVALIENAVTTGRKREMDDIPLQVMPTIPVDERTLTAEVETGYVEDTATEEAKRCYLCHFKYEIDNDLCIYCDGCLRVKPVENCIVKVKEMTYDDAGQITGYVRSTSAMDYNLLYIDQNECIRCGACADVCPVECIPMQKVNKRVVKTSEIH
jgi:NADPH-dependent glutamate synthase beta subunit-like oxidoreductase/ferredoxin